MHSHSSDSLCFLDHKRCQLAYRLQGNGPPVVFIQGTGVHGDGWRPQVDELQSSYTCLTFDNRGMAHSQPHQGPLTVPQMADDVRALMDHVGWETAHIVGHSLGGLIAQCFAIESPKRVRSLALLCTISRGKDAASPSWGMIWTGLRTMIGTKPMRRKAFCEIVLPPSLWPDWKEWSPRLEPLFGHDLATQPPIAMKQLGAMQKYDATKHLKSISHIPTLLVGCQYDRIATPAIMDRLATHFPDGRYVRFQDAAHGVPIQCSSQINALLREHWH